jgi:hypothetical protein
VGSTNTDERLLGSLIVEVGGWLWRKITSLAANLAWNWPAGRENCPGEEGEREGDLLVLGDDPAGCDDQEPSPPLACGQGTIGDTAATISPQACEPAPTAPQARLTPADFSPIRVRSQFGNRSVRTVRMLALTGFHVSVTTCDDGPEGHWLIGEYQVERDSLAEFRRFVASMRPTKKKRLSDSQKTPKSPLPAGC